jgi:AsmA protein
MNEITFNDFRGKTRIVNGKAEFDGRLLGRQLKFFPKGTLGLDGSLNLAMDTRLNPELAARLDQRGKVTRYLHDADGWSQVPLLVTGTLKAPRFGLDPKGIQDQAGKMLQQELQRGVDKLLNKQQPAPAASAEPAPQKSDAGAPAAPAPEPAPTPQKSPSPASPAQKLLEESLKRVLTR